jgi:hypothetical protein
LDDFPYAVRPGLEDIASTDAIVIEHVRLDQNLRRVFVQRDASPEEGEIPTLVYQAAKSTSFFTPMAI